MVKVTPVITIFISVFILLLAAHVAFANGGDQRVVEGRFLINLSRAPFTPKVGVKTSFLASFVDIQKNKLISEDLIVRTRISKLGDAPKGKFIFEQDNIAVRGGVLELPYTFAEPGLHEIFFDFAYASDPQKVYEAPDFLMDVQTREFQPNINRFIIGFMVSGIVGVVFGFVFGLWLGQRRA